MSEVEFSKAEGRSPLGLKDGGHNILVCSNCEKPLADVWVCDAKSDLKLKYWATCPYCGDHSYEKEIKGGVAPGGYARPIDGVSDEDWPLITLIEDAILQDDGTVKLCVIKNRS